MIVSLRNQLMAGPRASDGMPPPLRGADGDDTFTFQSIHRRLVRIIDSVIAHNDFSSDVKADLEGVQRDIVDDSALRDIPADSSWQPFLDALRDALGTAPRWTTAPWFLVENYFYRRVLLATRSQVEERLDPFSAQKQESLVSAANAFSSTVLPLWRKGDLSAWILRSLWGNRADMSLSAGEQWNHVSAGADHPSKSILEETGGGVLETHLLHDDRAVCLEFTETATRDERIIHIVLDNAGLELLTDLAFVAYLLRSAIANRVICWAKVRREEGQAFRFRVSHRPRTLCDFPQVRQTDPTFVSDATEHDVNLHVDRMCQWCEDPHWNSSEEREALAEICRCLTEARRDGRWAVRTHPFFVSPSPLWELPSTLHATWSEAHLVIFKGDGACVMFPPDPS